MKAQELRIGNWIHNPVQKLDFQCDIQTISKVYYENKLQLNPEEFNFQPILLTEEWLLEFGFEKKINRWTKWKIDLDFDEIDKEYSIDMKRVYLDIKYVHTLQNLYFALTGKELEINDINK